MPAARQLCRMSNTIAADDRPRTACPHCARKVTVTTYERVVVQGQVERRPIIPAHPRDEYGEMRVQMAESKNRYPRSSAPRG